MSYTYVITNPILDYENDIGSIYPLLSFKSHKITVLIAQNVAKAFLIDLSVYKLACRTIQNKPPAMDSRAAGSTKSRRIGTFIKRQMKIKNCFFTVQVLSS